MLNELILPILLVLWVYYVSKRPLSKTDTEITNIPNPYYKG
jgi:hypothetical protein